MKILVCVKQVPVTEAALRIDAEERWVELSDGVEFTMNRYDEFAVEEAILLKEAYPGTEIDIVSAGPARTTTTIKRALSMGADHGIHIVTEDQGYVSPYLTATRIASYAKGKKYDLILAGVLSEDAMQGQVGPMVAELVGLPCATSVVAAQIISEGAAVSVRREIEGGCRELLELTLPALLTIQSGINKPRYPSFSNIMRSKNQPLTTLPAESLGAQSGREELIKVASPPRMRSATVLCGTSQEKAAGVLAIVARKISIKGETSWDRS